MASVFPVGQEARESSGKGSRPRRNGRISSWPVGPAEIEEEFWAEFRPRTKEQRRGLNSGLELFHEAGLCGCE